MDRRIASFCLAGFVALAAACTQEKGAPATPAVTIADTGATTNPPAELPMDVQHRTMDSVQTNYGNLMTAVAAKEKTNVSVAASNIAGFADRIPVFMIHKADVAPDSLQRWARILKGQALRTSQLADEGNWDEASALAGRMNNTCTVCHEMYREETEEAHHDEEKPHAHAPGEEHAPKAPAKKS